MSRKKKHSGKIQPKDRDAVVHFTVGSLPAKGSGPKGGFFDFERELGPLKASLLYADRVTLCSVGASFMRSLDDLGKMPLNGKLALIRKYIPMIHPAASPEQLEQTYQIIESVKSGRVRDGSGRLGAQAMFKSRRYLDETWSQLQGRVQEEYSGVGAEGFREALQSGLVKLQPFKHISAEKIMGMGMATDRGSSNVIDPDETYEEYRDQILAAVGNSKTYPLFDDLTGDDIVRKAIRRNLISPSQGAVARSKHGGLSGDLLQRLPMFERAGVPAVLDIRKELSDHLTDFREAVGTYAEVIGPASWDEDFAEEASRIFREKVNPAVTNIEQAVEANRDLKELSYRFGPPAAVAVASSVGAFVGSSSVLGDVALLATGLGAAAYQGLAAHIKARKQVEANQLYFYYRAGKSLSASKR